MNVRKAVMADAERIAKIHVRSWQTAYKDSLPAAFLESLDVGKRQAMWRSCIENGGKLFVAENDDPKVIGFLNIAKARDRDLEEATELTAIYLDPKYYSSGIRTRFWKKIEKEITTNSVYLWVLSTNPIGIAFYEKNGFLPDGEKKSFQIDGQEFEELRYSKFLNH